MSSVEGVLPDRGCLRPFPRQEKWMVSSSTPLNNIISGEEGRVFAYENDGARLKNSHSFSMCPCSSSKWKEGMKFSEPGYILLSI